MHRVGINFDEISDDLPTAVRTMKECGITAGELRTVNGKNFVFWTDDEIATFNQDIADAGIELVAAATPLFKWYVDANDPDIDHDSFGFNPRIDDIEKRRIIDRTFEIASALNLPRLRIFSGLGSIEDAGAVFAHDPLLEYALDLADKHGIDLCIENEPVCRVHSKQHLIRLFNEQTHPRLKLWLDIANLEELGEIVSKEFLSQVADRLEYIHVKDFVRQDGRRVYVPVGEGELNFKPIVSTIHELVDRDLIFTVETHAKQDKVGASVKSIISTKKLVLGLGD